MDQGPDPGLSGEKARWYCREKSACMFHESIEVSGNRGTAREVRYVVEHDAVQIEQGLAEQGLYSRVLDRRTKYPTRINREEKAGACQAHQY